MKLIECFLSSPRALHAPITALGLCIPAWTLGGSFLGARAINSAGMQPTCLKWRIPMKCRLFAISAAACALLLTGGAALAQGVSSCAPGTNQDFAISTYSDTGSPTPSGSVDNLGQALAAGFYGNTSNAGTSIYAPSTGHGVTPSISPGPQTAGGDGPGTGTSIGGLITASCPPN